MSTATDFFNVVALGLVFGKVFGFVDLSWWLILPIPFIPLIAAILLLIGLFIFSAVLILLAGIVAGCIKMAELFKTARAA